MKNKKINIAILCGGESAEHEVSLHSADNIFTAINKEKYNPTLIGIDKSGKWLINEKNLLLNKNNAKLIKLNPESEEVVFMPGTGNLFSFQKNRIISKTDVVFPILHGTKGEDGSIQGLLKINNIPFVGADILGSVVGMDKEVMKILLQDADLPIGKFIVLRDKNNFLDFENIAKQLNLPFFLKPANMGSSVGVHKIRTEKEYKEKLKDAFSYDHKIILEEFIEGREVECAVLGNKNPKVSVPGEISFEDDFYSYETKYVNESGTKLNIPAKINETTKKKIQKIALKTFKTLSCNGLGRVDSFLKENGEIIVNEINTLPGFTQKSMYPKLWEASNLNYSNLIDKLIELALEKFQEDKKLKTNYF